MLFASQAAAAIANARTHRNEQRAPADLEALAFAMTYGLPVARTLELGCRRVGRRSRCTRKRREAPLAATGEVCRSRKVGAERVRLTASRIARLGTMPVSFRPNTVALEI